MTIQEAIALCDELKPNHYSESVKRSWLSKLDGQIFRELMMPRENCPVETFMGYADAEEDTELLVPYPYAEDVYNNFLQMQIDRENGETARYNQSVTMYNNAYRAFAADYNRNHLPIPAGRRFRF